MRKREKLKKKIKAIPVPMCWEGFVGCMAPWQTFCCTLLCEWIRPVCVKNWLREEQRSANWTWSKDQFLRSACLILSIKPMRKTLKILLAWSCKHCKENSNIFPALKISTGNLLLMTFSKLFRLILISLRSLVCDHSLHQLAKRLN